MCGPLEALPNSAPTLWLPFGEGAGIPPREARRQAKEGVDAGVKPQDQSVDNDRRCDSRNRRWIRWRSSEARHRGSARRAGAPLRDFFGDSPRPFVGGRGERRGRRGHAAESIECRPTFSKKYHAENVRL